MPIITDAAWSPESKWLKVSRLIFVPGPDEEISSVIATYSSTATPGDGAAPAIGEVNWDGGADCAAATVFQINTTDDLGGDQSVNLALLKINDQIQVSEAADRYGIFRITSEPVLATGVYSMGVSVVDHGIFDIRSARTVLVGLTIYPDSVLPQAPNVMEIRMAQEWPWVIYRIFADESSLIPFSRGVLPISDIRAIEVF